MIIPDPQITLGDLWLVLVGFICGLSVALIVWSFVHRDGGSEMAIQCGDQGDAQRVTWEV